MTAHDPVAAYLTAAADVAHAVAAAARAAYADELAARPATHRRTCVPSQPARQVVSITGPVLKVTPAEASAAILDALASTPARRGTARPHPLQPSHRLDVAALLDALPVEHSTPLHPRRRCRLHCGAGERGPCRATGAMLCKPPRGLPPRYIMED